MQIKMPLQESQIINKKQVQFLRPQCRAERNRLLLMLPDPSIRAGFAWKSDSVFSVLLILSNPFLLFRAFYHICCSLPF